MTGAGKLIISRRKRAAMQAYIQSIKSREIMRTDLLAVVEYLKGRGEGRIGVGFYSFCVFILGFKLMS